MNPLAKGNIFIYDEWNMKQYLISDLISNGQFMHITPIKSEAGIFSFQERVSLRALLRLRKLQIQLNFESL